MSQFVDKLRRKGERLGDHDWEVGRRLEFLMLLKRETGDLRRGLLKILQYGKMLRRMQRRGHTRLENHDSAMQENFGPPKKFSREVDANFWNAQIIDGTLPSKREQYGLTPGNQVPVGSVDQVPASSVHQEPASTSCCLRTILKPKAARRTAIRKSVRFESIEYISGATPSEVRAEVNRKRARELDQDSMEEDDNIVSSAKKCKQDTISNGLTAPTYPIRTTLPLGGTKRPHCDIADSQLDDDELMDELYTCTSRKRPKSDDELMDKLCASMKKLKSVEVGETNLKSTPWPIAQSGLVVCTASSSQTTMATQDGHVKDKSYTGPIKSLISHSESTMNVTIAPKSSSASVVKTEDQLTVSSCSGMQDKESLKKPISIPILRLASMFRSKLKLSPTPSCTKPNATQNLQNPFPLHLINQKKCPYLYKHLPVYHCIRQEDGACKQSKKMTGGGTNKASMPTESCKADALKL